MKDSISILDGFWILMFRPDPIPCLQDIVLISSARGRLPSQGLMQWGWRYAILVLSLTKAYHQPYGNWCSSKYCIAWKSSIKRRIICLHKNIIKARKGKKSSSKQYIQSERRKRGNEWLALHIQYIHRTTAIEEETKIELKR